MAHFSTSVDDNPTDYTCPHCQDAKLRVVEIESYAYRCEGCDTIYPSHHITAPGIVAMLTSHTLAIIGGAIIAVAILQMAGVL